MSYGKFGETMIGSKDLSSTSDFYQKFLGMKVSNPGDGKSFMILKDPATSQSLMIVADPSIVNSQPSIESKDLKSTLGELVSLGGKIVSQNEYPTMVVANVQDPDGRNMCVWQTLS